MVFPSFTWDFTQFLCLNSVGWVSPFTPYHPELNPWVLFAVCACNSLKCVLGLTQNTLGFTQKTKKGGDTSIFGYSFCFPYNPWPCLAISNYLWHDPAVKKIASSQPLKW